MFGLKSIKSLFSKKKESKEMDAQQSGVAPKRKHKLEIQVYEADYEKADANNGKPQWRAVRSDPALDGGMPPIIEVTDKKDLIDIQKQYALCDQKIKIIREIDPFPWDDAQAKQQQAIPQNNQAIPVQTVTPSIVQVTSTKVPSQMPQTVIVQTPVAAASPMPVAIEATKPKPKVVTIGDIEVKYDGDKVYQKQWMKLTPTEASNFRVVNDTNNKIVSMNGKHIEAKRWMLIEDGASSTDDDSVENLIEG